MCTYSQPAPAATDTGEVGERPAVVLVAGHAMTSAARDPAEFLDVDVDQLARPLAFIALGLLEPETSELAHPDPGQDPRHRRQRHPERVGDLRASEPQPPERGDRLDPPLAGAVRDEPRRRGPIEETGIALDQEPTHPLASAPDADLGGRGRLGHRPPFDNDTTGKQPPLVQAEGRVSVQLHPVSSLGLVASDTSSLQGGPDEPTSSGTTPRRRPCVPSPAIRMTATVTSI